MGDNEGLEILLGHTCFCVKGEGPVLSDIIGQLAGGVETGGDDGGWGRVEIGGEWDRGVVKKVGR